MRSKAIAVLSAVVISVVSVGGAVFAASTNEGTQTNNQQVVTNQKNISDIVKSVKFDAQTKISNVDYKEPNPNSASNPSKDERKDMIKIMRDNGFKDAARYMQTDDSEKMDEFMNNLREEDFQKMIELMKENGYESMAQMMESVGREGMIKMHNSMCSMNGESTGMSSMHTGGSGMMGGFTPGI